MATTTTTNKDAPAAKLLPSDEDAAMPSYSRRQPIDDELAALDVNNMVVCQMPIDVNSSGNGLAALVPPPEQAILPPPSERIDHVEGRDGREEESNGAVGCCCTPIGSHFRATGEDGAQSRGGASQEEGAAEQLERRHRIDVCQYRRESESCVLDG